VGVFEKTVFKRFLVPTGSRAHYAGKQPNASIEQNQRRAFPARQHDIAHRNLFHRAPGKNALVKPFEPAA